MIGWLDLQRGAPLGWIHVTTGNRWADRYGMYTVDNIYEGMYKLSYDMLCNTTVLYGVQIVNTYIYYIDTTSMRALPV